MTEPTTIITAIIFFLIDWLIKIAFIIYIPRKRNPSSAIAWLMVLFILPYVGIILFLLIGSPKLSKNRRNKQRYIHSLIDKNSPVKSNQFGSIDTNYINKIRPITELVYELGRFHSLEGNKVKILPEYDKAIEDIVKEIDKAEDFVHIEYFIIALDNTTQAFFDAMERAVKRGVSVRLMFDAMGYRAYPRRKEMKQELTRIGVDWHTMLPIKLSRRGYNRPDLRNHRKIVVIDDKFAYIGSQNMVDRSYHRKDDIYYDELVAKISGPAINACNAIFAGDWFTETGENISKEVNITKLAEKTGKTVIQMLPSGPNFDHANNARLFANLIHSAEKKIVITNPYFVPNEAILDAVTSAALRGVEVILINSESMDQWMVGHAQRSFYEELLTAGVKIFLYKKPILLHSKHMTIDNDIAVVGSSNMDIRSFELDLECLMIAFDKGVVKDLEKVQKQNLGRSRQISLNSWKKRSLWQDFRDSISRLTSALQ
ncbi:cardiolipin synthase [Candidatus Saccharibacteria bacterium]|nr:cardiolipin synthase [Candidatus Saccharibacteria bacterium]